VTLSTKHRSSIYRTLSRVIGEEEADALLSEFPTRDGDELVTKDFLRAELAEIRTELAEFRAEVTDRFRQQTIWMSSLMTALVGIVALVS
jgi:hypothetical protein